MFMIAPLEMQAHVHDKMNLFVLNKQQLDSADKRSSRPLK